MPVVSQVLALYRFSTTLEYITSQFVQANSSEYENCIINIAYSLRLDLKKAVIHKVAGI